MASAPKPGDRVVVRHLLSTGAATDLIGRLIDDGDPLVVERDRQRHRIARTAVVAFKTVPPRPVRPSEIRSLGLARARGWYSLEQQWVAGWFCRAAPGIAGNRANCASPLHPDAALDGLPEVRAWFAARSLPLRTTLTERLIRGADPEPERRTEVWTARTAASPFAGVALASGPDSRWLAVADAAPALAAAVDGTVRFASLGVGDRTIAVGRLALTDDAAGTLWAGISSVVVAPEHRRRGHASAIVRALVGAAADAGARSAYLEVEADNAPAQELYTALGFAPHHSYGYRTYPS